MSAATASAGAGMMTVRELFEGVRQGRLTVQRCGRCGVLAVPPRAMCPACESTEWSRAPLSGDGTVASFTVIRVPPARHAADAPYVIAIARMTEGVSLLGRLEGVAVDAVRVGLPVRFAPGPAGDEPPIIRFRPR